MADFVGDVLHTPGFGPEKWTGVQEELMASVGHGYTQKGGTLKMGSGDYAVGEPVKFDKASGYWVKDTAAPEGLIRLAVSTAKEDKECLVVMSGTVNGRVKRIQEVGVAALATALGGKVKNLDAYRQYIQY